MDYPPLRPVTDDLPERRKGHPYVMYDMLKDTPDGIRTTIELTEKQNFHLDREPFYFTGNGTAFHSAVTGAQILSDHDDRIKFVQAFELEKFWNPSGTIIAYSHTGKTKSTVDAVRKHSASNHVIGVSHYSDSPLLKNSDFPMVIGNSPDQSLCNTKAFFDNAFNAMIIASRITGKKIDVDGIADMLIQENDRIDGIAKFLAPKIVGASNIYVLGAGYDLVFARETAQKLREATHLRAEGIELEEFNHGCTAVMDENTLLIIASNDTVSERVGDIVRASREVGSKTLVLNGEGDYSMNYRKHENLAVNPLFNTLAVYYLGYYIAVEMGINPDLLRFEDRKYLNYDSVVFPPGAH